MLIDDLFFYHPPNHVWCLYSHSYHGIHFRSFIPAHDSRRPYVKFLKILGLVVSSASSSSFPVLNTEHTFHRMYMNGSPFSNSVFAVSQDAVIHSCPSRVVSSPLPSIRVIECSLPGKLFSNAYCSTTIPVHWCR